MPPLGGIVDHPTDGHRLGEDIPPVLCLLGDVGGSGEARVCARFWRGVHRRAEIEFGSVSPERLGLDPMMLNASSVGVPDGFQVIANGFIPDMGPNTGYHNPTLLLALLPVVLFAVLEIRKRAALRKNLMDVPPLATASSR